MDIAVDAAIRSSGAGAERSHKGERVRNGTLITPEPHVRSRTRYGTDIRSQRMDELDIYCAEFALKLRREKDGGLRAVDLGCGKGTQGLLLALMDFDAWIYDLDLDKNVAYGMTMNFGSKRSTGKITAVQVDLRTAGKSVLPERISIAYAQRFIHYLSWEKSVLLLQNLAFRMEKGAKLFVSAAGLNTEIGMSHSRRNAPMEDRLGHASTEMQEKHSIYEPLCIYSEDELQALVSSAGFSYERVWSSKFGNLKGVFIKK